MDRKAIRPYLVWIIGLLSVLVWSSQVFAAKKRTVILVDKSRNTLELAEYADSGYEIKRKYKTTVGRVRGDKTDQDDLKTPEGIYTFTSLLKPPHLKRKFGSMAFYMNYPNPFDRLAGYTGYDIMLHATDQPQRLEKNFDSKGCIVVKNEEIEELEPEVRLGLTPILVFEELGDNFRRPAGDSRLVSFFKSWVKSWEAKDIDTYMSHYHSDFKSAGKNKKQWRAYKNSLNQRYASIRVGPSQVMYLRHPKYSMVMFSQDYESRLKGDRPGFRSQGTKILYVAEEDGQPKVIDEDFTKFQW